MTLKASDNDITLFAKTNFRNREVPFGIRRDDRRRHMYIIGKTGMGKTTLIENMVIQDILNGHGVCFVDPHGDSVEKVLQYIPSNRINDIIYLNPADVDFPIAFNPLEAVDPKHKHLVASGLMGVFTKMWAGVWSPRMEYILQNTILALLDSPGNTMMGIARMYVDKVYRKKIIDNIKDPVVKSFWTDEFANYQDKFRTEAVAPIQNKVGQFLSNAIIRNIVGQTKSSIDLREIMDNKKILLLNLSKGRIGEDSSALLGAMIITKLQLAAMSRVDVPEEDRADFYLYVDEFQNFATESFASILSEARKYRLNLIVAHQYIGQLIQDRNTIVRDAIFGNVGTMITFRVGADDAEFLEKEFEPVYTMNDLVNLSKFSIYLKLMINGVASNPFSALTLPPISEPTGNIDKVINISRERYGTNRETVEQKISKWLGAEFHAEAARSESESVNEEGAEEGMRFKPVPRTTAAAVSRPSPVPVSAVPRAINPPINPGPVMPVSPRPAPERKAEPTLSAQEKVPSARDLPEPGELRVEKPIPPKPAVTPPSRPMPPKSEVRHEPRLHDRRESERRERQTFPHLKRRLADKPEKPKSKHENPVWETVSKLASEKLAERTSRANQALETLTKSLQKSVVKNPPHKPVQAPKITPPQPVKPIANQDKDLELSALASKTNLGHLTDPVLSEEDVNPQDKALSPHENVQQAIARFGELKPGDTVKFD
jgi:hypothetical protein